MVSRRRIIACNTHRPLLWYDFVRLLYDLVPFCMKQILKVSVMQLLLNEAETLYLWDAMEPVNSSMLERLNA